MSVHYGVTKAPGAVALSLHRLSVRYVDALVSAANLCLNSREFC